jgi:lipoate-protein ligase A
MPLINGNVPKRANVSVSSASRSRLIPYGCFGPAENMAIDQMLLESVARSGETTLRFYGWSEPTLSLGYFQSLADRGAHPASASLAVVRRATGGGAIVHHHELTYSLVMPADSAVFVSNLALYENVHLAIIHALRELDIGASTFAESGLPAGEVGAANKTVDAVAVDRPFMCFQRRSDNDLIVNGYKILGSAQRRSREAVLQHGSLLLRASEFAAELPGIRDLTGRQVEIDETAAAIAGQLRVRFGMDFDPRELSSSELQWSLALAQEQFALADWTAIR